MSFKVLKAGLFTTVQDLGRYSYQRFGMSVAGAMDPFSPRVANILVGNKESEAVLETTFMGPTLEFNSSEAIAITGADMAPKINGRPAPMWKTILVRQGDLLSFGGVKSGLRSYIAFSRGLDVPVIMGSKSTFTRGKIGGFEGRKLSDGDQIGFERDLTLSKGSYLKDVQIPEYRKDDSVRVVLGPQDDHFPEESIETFLSSTYSITNEADRMGYRLEGEKIIHKDGADIISDGIVFGSIQVPGHGMPIIMMADRATTGGYTKIATVITPDLSKVAQMGPGSKISFSKVSAKEASEIYRENEKRIEEIRDHIAASTFNLNETRSMNLKLKGKSYSIEVNEIV
jgi:biotin-dependent carboxylase-like uncharacterized protein